MTDLSFNILFLIWLFLAIPFIISLFLTRYLRFNPFIGYILGGVVINLFFKSFFSAPFINNFSLFGLNLLIFTLGLQINLSSLLRFGKFVVVGGLLQLLITIVSVFILSLVFHLNFLTSLFFSIAFATASTAMVGKIIQERGEEGSLLGGLAIGLLIFQDITFIPLFIVFSSFSPNQTFFSIIKSVFVNLVKAGFILGLVYYFGQKLVPLIFNKVSRVSRELLNILVVVFIISALMFFSYFGLSTIMASFLAGVILAQTIEHYHIFSEIRPLRDLLVTVFFIFLGLYVNPLIIGEQFFSILLFLLLLYVLKIVIVLIIYLRFHFHSKTAFSLALNLSGVGEDAFLFLFLGFNRGIISQRDYNFGLALVLISFILTPLFINKREIIYLKIRSFVKKYLPFLESYLVYHFDREVPNVDVLPLKNHIVLCGYGRVGSLIGRALLLANIPFIAIDYNFHVVERAKKAGVNIIYGDPTEIDVLDYAQCDEASILIVALPDRFSRETVILNARKLNPNLAIFVRVHHEEERLRVKDLGAHVVVQPETEASVSIIRRILLLKGLAKEEIAKKIKQIKEIY